MMVETYSKTRMQITSTDHNKQRSKKHSTMCKICGEPALFSHFGAYTCNSCGIFFRRNVNKKQNVLKCHYNNDCEITIHNRHICTYCRLEKCIQSGMSIHTVRTSRNTQTRTTHQPSLTTTVLILPSIPREINESQQVKVFLDFILIQTLNLLQLDQSILTIEKWNLLSNLIDCFDEYNGFSLTQHFIQEQNQLPIKMRFKLISVTEFYLSLLSQGKLFYEKNPKFLSLCPYDRSILLTNTMKYVATLSASFIIHHSGLLENPAFCTAVEILYGSNTLDIGSRAVNQLDTDGIFIKLILTLLPFSTFNYTYYRNMSPVILTNIKSILNIQDMYTDLIWRYLVYKYGHKRAVICFLNLMRCLLLINDAFVEAMEHKDYIDMIGLLIKQTLI